MSNRQLALPIPEPLYARFQANMPWGQRAKIVIMLIEQLCDMIEQNPDDQILVKLYTGRVQLKDISDAKLSPEDAERAIGNYFSRQGKQKD